jgi:radical SAM protein with 4Fe4S-binding SPASM domain
MPRATRRRLLASEAPTPRYVVWEITLRCDQPCAHCGSRAGAARPKELSTAEALDVVRQLGELGTREVTLIGGEAYLRRDAPEIVEALTKLGIVVTIQTGGRAMTQVRLQKFKDAGLYALGVSVDGTEAVHDVLRNNKGSFAAAMRALEVARELGIPTASNMQINRLSAESLWELSAALRDRGVRAWRAQLTVPMGNAADRPEWILQPWRVVDVIDTLAAIQVDAVQNPRPHELPHPKRTFDVSLGNNLGYYGPHETLLRSHPGGLATHWAGCGAGIGTMSIESDGTIKACPSLPTAPYRSGNVLDQSLAKAWEDEPNMRFARDRDGSDRWGFCKTCVYGDVCQAGCNFTTHSAFGRRGNNPFCYHRVTTLRKQGIRERIERVEAAGGVPYDFGRFEIVEEPVDGAEPAR